MNAEEQAKLLGLDEDEFFELVELFVETTASDLAKLESAISNGTAGPVVEAAHSIKGAAANLGFPDIHELAKNIEMSARQDALEGGLEAAKTIREKLALIAQTTPKTQAG